MVDGLVADPPSAADTRPATTEVIREPCRLRALEGDWRRLAERSGNAFLTPDWFGAWLSHYGSSAEPAVAITRARDGSLTGLVPLVTLGRSPWRSVRFAGANVGDRFHPLTAGPAEAEVAAQAFGALSRSPRPAAT